MLGSIGEFKPGEYGINGRSKKNISDIWLYLMGVKEPVRILGTQEFGDVAFTIGTFAYMLVVDEETVSQFDSVIMTKLDGYSKTTCQSALLYLITGKSFWDGEKHLAKKERDTQKNAQIAYMTEYLAEIAADYNKKKAEYSELSQEDLQKRIEVILDEIDSAESDLSSAIEESRDLAMKTFQIDQQISECSMMQERYGVLRSQYSSDIQRLTFIIEGELHKAGLPKMARCPFCDGEIKKKEESCAEAAKEEVKRLLPQIQDLEDAMMDADLEAAQLAKERDELHKTRKELEDRINSEMKPKLTELREALSKYSRAIEERKEDSVYVKFMSDVGGRIRDLEDTVNRKEMYCIEEDFEKIEFIKNFEMVFKTVLEQTNYGDISSALFSFSDYDVIVNNKQKYRYGQGYRAFLNTDILIALQEFLRQYGKHQPGILAIDSPTLTLKEKPVEDEASHGMKYGLFKYLLEHQRDDKQVIIIENDLPDMDKLDYSKANVQLFTKDPGEGRYGLLNGVTS